MFDSTKTRPLTTTEHNWSRAVSHGTGTTVLALQIAKPPSETSLLRETLSKLQTLHPLLSSKLRHDPTTREFCFVKSASPINVRVHDLRSTATLLRTLSDNKPKLSPCHLIMEHELNHKSWSDPSSFPSSGVDVVFANVYSLSDAKIVVVLRLHAAMCDRTTAVSLLMELMGLAAGGADGTRVEGEGKTGVEGLIPKGMGKKSIWAHGVDMLGYGLNSLRLQNLKFEDVKAARSSEVVRLRIGKRQTDRILEGCKSRGIKLCGALAAAGLIAAHSTKQESDHKKKYGVVTLTDCRSLLQPTLSTNHYGFYHSALLNIHALNGTETFWDLATAVYTDFARYKKCNKHFSDMADINFLMRKAMENPSLTASSSLRTSLLSVFEDPVVDDSQKMQREIGVEDYIGCASIHGVGPSVGIFDTIRDGELDCACVYPSPLHSREQMEGLIDRVKKILVDESSN